MSHTKEPWHVGGNGTIIYAEDGFAVANATVFHGRHDGESEHNARRIFACVNACAGIPTELLEQGLGLGAILNSEVIEYAELEKQRDDLLAALEHAEYTLQGFSTDMWSSELLKDVRAAIASVKGQPCSSKTTNSSS